MTTSVDNEIILNSIKLELYFMRREYFLNIAKAKKNVRRMLRASKERVKSAATILIGIHLNNKTLENERSGGIISFH